ncbi:Serine/threonine-protein kinase PknB [Rubripirellula lacrimiformis]|uniref:non-specific serine/threonine protein kinase n=1 Tax=Rubripirellula lacrimiformis TaxID=1930273 RepID=A0A517NIQ1_9BACT|nr:bifunctional serine/threonine-protein kinase/formylglycine-generating enzyme family protein [Rubripirellula lacrimiformis]QDT07017.1 Serine/threonine-protein kinase PknB [Rubripirellula lacrimiformis]
MRERTLFLTAKSIEDPTGRHEYLDRVCGSTGPLRQRIDSLLRSSAGVGNFLEKNDEDLEPGGTLDSPSLNSVTTDSPTAEMTGSTADLSFLAPSKVENSLGRLAHYEILELIGQGGFGMVFRASDPRLGREVAIKVLMPHFAVTSPPRKRFLREARACAAVRHPNVVHVYGVEDDPLPAIVMELIEGSTLQRELDNQGPLEIDEVLRIAIELADGLAAAHRSGLVHRDLKPSNVLLEHSALHRVILTDFGLARTVDDASLTQTGAVIGTPMYMAPEQATGKPVDARADLFSFGSVMYVMVTGRPPFRGPTSMAVMQRVAQAQPRPISELVPDCPPLLSRLIERLMAKSPGDRIQTAEHLKELLVATSHDRAAAPTDVMPDIMPVADPPPSVFDRHRWRRSIWAVIAFAPLIAIAVASVFWWNQSEQASAITNFPATEETNNLPSDGITELAPVHASVSDVWGALPRDAPSVAMAPFNTDAAVQHQQRWAEYFDVPVDFTDPRGIEFRLIPPGQFAMGSPQQEIEMASRNSSHTEVVVIDAPVRQVALTRPFYLAVTEMTQQQYESVMSQNPSRYSANGYRSDSVFDVDTDKWPVESMAFSEMQDCINRLNLRYGFTSWNGPERTWVEEVRPAIGYRLPTEAEWEFACRAGTETPYWTGDGSEVVAASENVLMFHGSPWDVENGKPNPFGLRNMHGNVREFVSDFCQPPAAASVSANASDGSNHAKEVIRVNPLSTKSKDRTYHLIRGGDYYYPPVRGRSGSSLSHAPDIEPGVIVGLRLAMSVETGRRLHARAKPNGLRVTSFREVHGVDRENLNRWVERLKGNHVPIAINLRHGDDTNLFDAVAVDRRRSVPSAEADWRFDAMADDDAAGKNYLRLNQTHGEVWRTIIPKFGKPPLKCEALSIWRTGRKDWGTYNLGPDDPNAKLAESCREAWMPISICHVRSEDKVSTHFMHIYLPGVGCHAYASLSLDEFKGKLKLFRARDWRPILMQANTGTEDFRIACTFRENSDAVAWEVSSDLSTAEFEAELLARKAADFYPASFVSHADDGIVKYIVLWRSMAAPIDAAVRF